jgi:hypothetical protein
MFLRNFYKAYHQLHKEPKTKLTVFEESFKFITKVLNDAEEKKKDINWPGLSSFKVGRPLKCREAPFKRMLLAFAVLGYLAFGLLLWIFLRMTRENKKLYPLGKILFLWPQMFKIMLDVLKTKKN